MLIVSLISNNVFMSNMSGEMADHIANEIPETQALNRLAAASYAMRMDVLVIARTPEPEVCKILAQRIGEKRQQAEAAYAIYEESLFSDKGKAIYAEISELWDQWISIIERIYATSEAGRFDEAHTMQLTECEPVFHTYEKALEKYLNFYSERQDALNEEKMASIQTKIYIINVTGIILLVGILITATFVYFGVTTPISRFLINIRAAAEETRKNSDGLARSSETLAQGAGNQASAVLETSASLKDISEMIQSNTEHTVSANSLGTQSKGIVEAANNQMNSLISSMAVISQSSERTQDIVKTIDEIAFQTNILALNAAVEAARAGEAGAGFAVVADEVRSLAMRASTAASETSQLIVTSVGQINIGTAQANEANEAFAKVEQSVEEISTIVRKIAEGSKEQSASIEQLSGAVGEIDKVVQNNSRTADRSAASAENLKQQSDALNESLTNFYGFMGMESTERS
ncbi:MAG: methyl-accepting chemotaxis protein [Opitutales bacterium]|nr:methyl-accepting chemotaxis protein [Opitutales bacterium]